MKILKKILIIFVCLNFLICCLIEKETSFLTHIIAASNPYSGGYSNCTATAWQLAYDNAGIALPGWNGNAVGWRNGAINSGYEVSNVPRANSIAVWNDGNFGHVAYVREVSGNRFFLQEGGYIKDWPNGSTGYNEGWYNISNDSYHQGTIIGYIYLTPSVTKPTAPTNLKVNTNMTNITANWQPSSGATTYIVKVYNRYTCSGNDLIFDRDVGNVTSASFTLEPGHYWCYIHAWNEAGQSEGSNYIEFDVVDKIPSPIPVAIKGYSGVYNGKSHTISMGNLPEGSIVYYRTNTNTSWSRTKPTRTRAGTTTIYYKIMNNKYANDLMGNSKIVINKAKQPATVKSYSGTYDGKAKTISITNVSSGSKIYYRTSTKGNWTTRKPTRTSTGATKVYYKITNSNCISTKSGSANITIKKAAQKASVKGYSGTYDGKAKTIKLTNVLPGSKIYYRTNSRGKWVTKKPTRTSAGTTKVYYKIINHNCDKTKTGNVSVSIKKMTQKATVKSYNGVYDGKKHSITISNVTTSSKIYYRISTKGKWTTAKPYRTGNGTTKIYYKITKNNYNDMTGFAQITVNSKLSINKTLMTLDVPNNITLKATVLSSKSSDKAIKWSSSNSKVAVVDSSGKVTAKTAGTANITAKAGNGQSVKCNVRVNQKNAYIPNGVYTFASMDQKFALSVPFGDAASGKRLNTWETYGGNDQNWFLYNIGNNKFVVQSNINRSLVMDVVHMDPNNIFTADETGNSNEGKVGLFTYTDTKAQEWVATKFYDGRVVLHLASKPQYILARGGNSDANGNTIYIYYGNYWNQTYWNLIKR